MNLVLFDHSSFCLLICRVNHCCETIGSKFPHVLEELHEERGGESCVSAGSGVKGVVLAEDEAAGGGTADMVVTPATSVE